LGAATDGIGDEAHGLLKYATVPLHGAADILESRLPQALGLIIGFNSLDGD
jgi:predicted lipoprotein